MAFAVFQPLKVLPRIRLAPGFALTDSNGDLITSEDTRGQLTIYSFAPVGCGDDCIGVESTLSEVKTRLEAGEVDLGDTTFQIVTIALDSRGDPIALAEATELSGADGSQWVWAGGSDENVKTVVGAGFGRYFENRPDGIKFDQSLVLVDGWGVVRGDYRFETLDSDADKIIYHLQVLVDEIKYSHGAATVAYEAAHLFLCYP